MEFKIVEQSSNKLVAHISGADHTIMNVVVRQLQQDKQVIAAAYTLEHPLAADPKLIIQTQGKATPKAALLDAVASLKKEYTQFSNAFTKAFS